MAQTIQQNVGLRKGKKLGALPTACWQLCEMPKQLRPPAASAAKAAFAARLEALRLSYGAQAGQPGISMKDFAALLNLEAETYRSYESGRTEPPLWVLAAIRRLTGVNLNNLVGGEIDRAA